MTLAPHVAIDEAVLAVMRTRQPKIYPEFAADRTAAEMAATAALFEKCGWVTAPATYHRTPPPLHDSGLLELRTRTGPLRHETMTFASEFTPRAVEPGAARRPGNHCNDTVFVRLLGHHDPGAPWVVCLHGFGIGSSRFDLAVLWATYLHTKLGFNVAVPVSPLHGPRRSEDDDQLLSLDLTGMLHGITQALWDVRRLVSWIRSTSDAPVGVYGLSLGGFLATMLAGLEPLDAVVAALPFVDVLGLMEHHGPPAEYQSLLRSADARNTFRVASPLSVPAVVPADRLALFAARGDRLIPVDQSCALHRAWQDGDVQWTNTGHVGFTWSRQARGLVGRRLHTALHAGR
ncbi:prolyl oligopeptidase family serine peptidase [Mycolicibacterium sp. 050232]|uniref:alpha/beta hydrolase family protein n=1 Tax=Mycolicibacterium sp. 050232 TaxID=3113982 RepID=UPI002E2DF6B4|nr:prolyl oligopeptidase family serine peptidase [Mycolicibacterium sp. 050232]MED5811581.1 prolyl oligopeptidase family serine peptidase [Mycolicibacterium sp. 050232]